MSQRECVHCARPVKDGAPLCRTCTDGLRDALREVPDLFNDLLITIAREDRLGAGKSTRGGEQPAPRLDTTRALDRLVDRVIGWASTLATYHDLPIPWPARRVGQDAQLHRAATAADWMADHMRLLRGAPCAVRAHRELRAAIARAQQRVDRPEDRTRFPVGPCPETGENGQPCNGEVWAHVPTDRQRQDAELRCRTCGSRWDTTQWRRAGARITARRNELREAGR